MLNNFSSNFSDHNDDDVSRPIKRPVKNVQGELMVGVQVTLSSNTTNMTLETNESGIYETEINIPFTVSIIHEGYEPYEMLVNEDNLNEADILIPLS